MYAYLLICLGIFFVVIGVTVDCSFNVSYRGKAWLNVVCWCGFFWSMVFGIGLAIWG